MDKLSEKEMQAAMEFAEHNVNENPNNGSWSFQNVCKAFLQAKKERDTLVEILDKNFLNVEDAADLLRGFVPSTCLTPDALETFAMEIEAFLDQEVGK